MSTTEASRRFHFLREIASGGFGRVYLAKVVHADGFSRLAAVKVLHPKWVENEEVTQRMRDEARLLGMLRHKNIVDVLDLTRIDGRAAMIMEYLEAVDLKVLIGEAKRREKKIPLKVVLSICAAVASALDAAYNRPPYSGEKPLRVIHRDIKPSNIMVDASGLPKVLDFGVARAEFEAREAKTQELAFGSVEYMPPERLFFEPDSPASDVYGLGTTLYEAIALEKFGKAKLRADEHERYVAERFEDLLEKHPMPTEEIEDMLHDLLYDMLAFEDTARPSAGDCVIRMRAFARTLPGETLEEWAEQRVPPLVQKYQDRPPRKMEGDSTSLVDKVLAEDTGGLGHQPDDITDLGPEEEAPVQRASKPSGDDPARWDALKQATLASLAGEGLGPASSTWYPDAEASGQPPMGAPQGASASNAPSAARPQPQGDLRAPPSPQKSQVVPPAAPPPRSPREPAPPAPPAPPPQEATLRHPGSSARPIAEREPPPPRQVEVAKPRPPQPVPTEPSETWPEEPAPSAGSWVLVALVAGMAVMMLVGLGGVVVTGIVLVALGQAPSGAPAPVPEPVVVAPTPDPSSVPVAEPQPGGAPSPEPATAPVPAGGARFVSRLAGTKKLMVRCPSGTVEGVDEVAIAEADPGQCTVTALGADRKRGTAVVSKVEAREYVCFAEDDKTCE